jgi:hypothetical protein
MPRLVEVSRFCGVVQDRPMRALLAVLVLASGCGQSALDECMDRASDLWNSAIDDNRYEGNEAYWDAVGDCEDEHG